MIGHSNNTSESWTKLPWKHSRRNLFRLQKRVYKAVLVGDYRKAKSRSIADSEIYLGKIAGYPSSIATKRWEKDTLVSMAKPNSLLSKGLN